MFWDFVLVKVIKQLGSGYFGSVHEVLDMET